MSDIKHVIDPERFGIWIAVTFVVALMALVLSVVGLKRTHDLAYVTQAEVLILNKKIEKSPAPAKAPETSEQQKQE